LLLLLLLIRLQLVVLMLVLLVNALLLVVPLLLLTWCFTAVFAGADTEDCCSTTIALFNKDWQSAGAAGAAGQAWHASTPAACIDRCHACSGTSTAYDASFHYMISTLQERNPQSPTPEVVQKRNPITPSTPPPQV
jgi:hypothetical protein